MARLKKIEAMHYFYGFDHLCRKCVECDHLIHGEYNGKWYYKCKVYGCTHSESTDWRKSYSACGLVDHDFPEHDKRIIDILKHEQIQKVEQIPGQVGMFG